MNTYKQSDLMHIRSMLKAVFGSKAVLALTITLALITAGILYLAFEFYHLINTLFNSETFRNYILSELAGEFSEYEYEYSISVNELLQMTQNILQNMTFFLLIPAAAGLWAFFGTLHIYLRSNSSDEQASPRAGFTALQALAITVLVIMALPWLLMALVGLIALLAPGAALSALLILVWTTAGMMQTISLIVFTSSAKKAVDNTVFKASGAGVLQFSSLMMAVISIVSCILGFINMAKFPEQELSMTGLPQSVLASLNLFSLVSNLLTLAVAVACFLVFLIAKHYAQKLPLAINAQNAYHANMSNLYPDSYNGQLPPESQPYRQQPDGHYYASNSFQPYQSPQPPQSSGGNYYTSKGFQPYQSPQQPPEHEHTVYPTEKPESEQNDYSDGF